MSDPPYVRDPIIAAYYARVLSYADTVRGRAQSAYAIVSTLAAGLVGLGLLANVAQLPPGVRLLALGATGTWAAAAATFVGAASTAVRLPGHRGTEAPTDTAALVTAVLDDAKWERDCVRRRLRAAVALGAVATLVTAVTLVIAVNHYPPNTQEDVTVLLAPAGIDLLAKQCRIGGADTAVVDVNGLTSASSFLDVVIRDGPGQGCHVLLPRTSALGFKLP